MARFINLNPSSKKIVTFCYFATINDRYVSDEYSTRSELQKHMRERGYYPWEFDILCVCEEWFLEDLLRLGTGATQREAYKNLK